jgi:hypothetical protein
MIDGNELILTPLHDIAHARTGDKGNRANISVIAYRAALYPIIVEQVTEEKIRRLFEHRGVSTVKRYELPLLHALNFVIDDVLEGGVNGSLNLDGHGKTLSFRVLSLPLRVPARLLAAQQRS